MKGFLIIFILLLLAGSVAAQGSRGNSACACAELVIRPEIKTLKANEVVTDFVIVSDDPHFLKQKFEWTASLGEIVNGQGTPRITVAASRNDSNAADFTELVVTAKRADVRNCNCKPQQLGLTLAPSSLLAPFFARVHKRRQADVINRFADVTDLRLGQTTVVLPCPPGVSPLPEGILSTSTVVDVETLASDPENDVLAYDYKVSGGIIRGKGAKVKWDLGDVQPGTYTITAGVDDGCGPCGRTLSQTVTVREGPCTCGLIECPSVSFAVSEEDPESGTILKLTANVEGGSQQSVTYAWSLVNGEIIGGQGSPSITIKLAPNIKDKNLSVSLKIGGLDPLGACMDTVSEDFFEGRTRP